MTSPRNLSLKEFPLEVVHEVIKWCLLPPKACSIDDIQLTCKLFLRAANLLPRPTLHLGCPETSARAAGQEIKRLSLGRSQIDSMFVKKLCIDFHDLLEKQDKSQVLSFLEKMVLEHLAKALRTLVNLEQVHILVRDFQPNYILQQTLYGLRDMSSLRHVTITSRLTRQRHVRVPEPIDFTPLSNLESFTLVTELHDGPHTIAISQLLTRCPDLIFLCIESCNGDLDGFFQCLFAESCPVVLKVKYLKLRLGKITSRDFQRAMRHLSCLETLDLYITQRELHNHGQSADLWVPFIQAKKFVHNISTNWLLDRSFLPYIRTMIPSRPNLSTSWAPIPGGVFAIGNLSYRHYIGCFLKQVSADFQDALIELRLDTFVSWKWPFDPTIKVLEAMSNFKRLKRLHVAMTRDTQDSTLFSRPNQEFCDDCMQQSVIELVQFCYSSYPVLEELHLSLEYSSSSPISNRWVSQHDYLAPHVVHPHFFIPWPIFNITEKAILSYTIPQSWSLHFDILLCGILYEVWRDPGTSTPAYVKSRNIRTV